MPRPVRNQHKEASPGSSTQNSDSGTSHDRRTRASRRNALRNSNTRVSQTPTGGRTFDGDHTDRHTNHDPALTAGRLAELCSECECYLCPEENEANERNATSTAPRGRCDECYRKSPAPIANRGGPSYSFGTSYVLVPQTMFTPWPTTRAAIMERIREFVKRGQNGCTHPQELPQAMRNDDATEWTEAIPGIKNLISLTSPVTRPWSAMLTHFARLAEPIQGNSKLEQENDPLQEELDHPLICLELSKGTTSGGPQRYSVPIFNTRFTDVCS